MQLNGLIEAFYDTNAVLFVHQLNFMIVNGAAALYSCCMLLTTGDGPVSELHAKELLLDFRLSVVCFAGICFYSEQGYQLEKKVAIDVRALIYTLVHIYVPYVLLNRFQINTDMRTQLLKMNMTGLAPAIVNEVNTYLIISRCANDWNEIFSYSGVEFAACQRPEIAGDLFAEVHEDGP